MAATQSSCRGRVLVVQQEGEQPVDFDPWRPVSWLLWGAAALFLPPCILAGVWMYAGPLQGIVAVLMAFFAMSWILPRSLLGWLQLVFFTRGREPRPRVPVLIFRLRDDEGRECVARLKGHLTGANVAPGDRVMIWGRDHRGVLRVRRAFSETSEAWVTARQPCQATSAICAAGLLITSAVWLHGPFASWAHANAVEMKQRMAAQREIQLREQHARAVPTVRRAAVRKGAP